jgi:hypothetical protein
VRLYVEGSPGRWVLFSPESLDGDHRGQALFVVQDRAPGGAHRELCPFCSPKSPGAHREHGMVVVVSTPEGLAAVAPSPSHRATER